MNSIKLIIDLFGAFFEIYMVFQFFSLLFERKSNNKRQYFFLFPFSLFLLISSNLVPEELNSIPFISFFAVFILSYIFRAQYIIRIIISLIIFSMFMVSEILIGMILISTNDLTISITRENLFFYLCAVILSKFIVYLIFLIVREKVAKNKMQKPKYIFAILIMPVCSTFIIYLLFLLTYGIQNRHIVILVEIAVILLVMANMAIIYIINKLLDFENSKKRIQFMEKQLELQSKHYKEMEQSQSERNEFYHNMKNYLLAVGGYLNNKEYDRAKEKIYQANENLFIDKHRIHTGNICLDALLVAKMVGMKQEGIEFEHKINMPDKLTIDYIDFCIIIGNAMDNAIEACCKIKEGIRKISLICTQVDDYITIIIINTISAEMFRPLDRCQDGTIKSILTTKQDNRFHGYGVQSIKNIAEKNKGNILIKFDKNIFQIKIILYNEIN